MLPEDILDLVTPPILPAVFESRAQAEAAIADLKAHGLDEDQLGIAMLDIEPGDYRLLDEEERNELFGLIRGAEVGAPVGALAGIALAAFAIPGIGTVISGGGLAVAGVSAYWGALCGAWAGLLRKTHYNADEERWVEIPMQSDDVLVVIKPDHHYEEIHRILLANGARYFLDPKQPEHPIGLQPAGSR
jgi:hypothetical protein